MIVQACDRPAPTPWKVREKPPPSPPGEAPNRPSGSSHAPIITAFATRFKRRTWGPTGHAGIIGPQQTPEVGPDRGMIRQKGVPPADAVNAAWRFSESLACESIHRRRQGPADRSVGSTGIASFLRPMTAHPTNRTAVSSKRTRVSPRGATHRRVSPGLRPMLCRHTQQKGPVSITPPGPDWLNVVGSMTRPRGLDGW
jgi:hypothetical protein